MLHEKSQASNLPEMDLMTSLDYHLPMTKLSYVIADSHAQWALAYHSNDQSEQYSIAVCSVALNSHLYNLQLL